MAIGSKNLNPDALDKIEDSVLVEELKKAKEELFNLRFQSATGQLENHGRLRAVKRDIARIYTIILSVNLAFVPFQLWQPLLQQPRQRRLQLLKLQ